MRQLGAATRTAEERSGYPARVEQWAAAYAQGVATAGDPVRHIDERDDQSQPRLPYAVQPAEPEHHAPLVLLDDRVPPS